MKKCNNWLQKNAVGWKVTFPGSMRRAEEWRWVLFPYLWGKWVEKIWTIVKSGIRKKFWVERSLSLVPFFMSLTMRILILLKSIIPQTALSCRGPGGSLRPVEGRTGTVPKLLPHFACVFTVFQRSRFTPLQQNGVTRTNCEPAHRKWPSCFPQPLKLHLAAWPQMDGQMHPKMIPKWSPNGP